MNTIRRMLASALVVASLCSHCATSGSTMTPADGGDGGLVGDAPWSTTATGFTLRQVALGQASPDGGPAAPIMNVEYDATARTLRGPVSDRWGSNNIPGTLRMVDHTLSEADNNELLTILRALRAATVTCSGFDGIYTSITIGANSYAIGGYNSCSVAPMSRMLPAISNGDSLLPFINRFAR